MKYQHSWGPQSFYFLSPTGFSFSFQVFPKEKQDHTLFCLPKSLQTFAKPKIGPSFVLIKTRLLSFSGPNEDIPVKVTGNVKNGFNAEFVPTEAGKTLMGKMHFFARSNNFLF